MACHLTLQEREMVSEMHHAHAKQVEIARRLGRHPSTISRELHRNRSRDGYRAASAQQKAEKRRSERPWTCKMERPEIARYTREGLRQYWSPDDPRRHVSRQTIYTWIHSQRAAGIDWRRYLRRLGRVRRARKIAANCRLASRSKDVRPWSIVGRDTATGKATRWLGLGIAPEPSPWWTGNRDTF